MRLSGKITVLFLAVALALCLGGAADGAGRKARVSSTISLDSLGPDGAWGRVSSGSKDCRSQRRVSFYRVNSGPSVPSSEPMGSTWTHGGGYWTIPGPLPPSQYYAVVVRKGAKGVACSSSDSNTRYV
jgi:hypothetical protein